MSNGQVALNWLLDYEVRSSVRYRRHLSLLVMAHKHSGETPTTGLDNELRASDQVVPFDDKVAVVMGETSRAGALCAAERLKRRCQGTQTPFRCGIATFPVDGCGVKDLMYCAFRRYQEAKMRGPVAIVWSD